jgi:hypothetical protein
VTVVSRSDDRMPSGRRVAGVAPHSSPESDTMADGDTPQLESLEHSFGCA